MEETIERRVKQVETDHKRRHDDYAADIEDIKDTIDELPCNDNLKDCPQEKNIVKITEVLIPPIITKQEEINLKQDVQQETLVRIEDKLDCFKKTVSEDIMGLKLDVNTVKTVRETESDLQRKLREKVAWGFGTIGGLIMVYNFVKLMISTFA